MELVKIENVPVDLPALPEGLIWRIQEDQEWVYNHEAGHRSLRLVYRLAFVKKNDRDGDEVLGSSVITHPELTEEYERTVHALSEARKAYSTAIDAYDRSGLFSRKAAKVEKNAQRLAMYALENEIDKLNGQDYCVPLNPRAIYTTAERLVRDSAELFSDYNNKIESARFVGDYPPLKLSEIEA